MSDRAQSPSGSDASSDSQGSSSWVVKTFSRVPSPSSVGARVRGWYQSIPTVVATRVEIPPEENRASSSSSALPTSFTVLQAGAGSELNQNQPGPAVYYYGGLDGEAESFVSDEDEDSIAEGRGGSKAKGDKSRSDDESAAEFDT